MRLVFIGQKFNRYAFNNEQYNIDDYPPPPPLVQTDNITIERKGWWNFDKIV